MNPNRLVGSLGVRLTTFVFSLLCVTVVMLHGGDRFPTLSKGLMILAVGSGVLAFIGLIYSFKVIYALWMRFAAILHAVIVTLLFAICYLVVVPVFFLIAWPFDPLRLRNRSEPDTFWVRKRSTPCDLSSLERMG